MKINKDCVVNSDGFLFNPHSGESFSVNDTAMDLLSLLKVEHTEQELFEHLKASYEVDEFTLKADLNDFLFLLRIKGVVDE